MWVKRETKDDIVVDWTWSLELLGRKESSIRSNTAYYILLITLTNACICKILICL